MSGNDTQLDRRSVLKTIGSTAIAGIGLGATSSTVAAIESTHHLEKAYSDPFRLRFAFDQHAEGVRQTLVNEGFVAEDFDFGDLAFDIDESVNGLHAQAEDHSATVSAHTVEGTPTAIGVVSTSSDTHDVSLYVQPERDEAYAFVEAKDSDERFIATASDVSPTSSTCPYTECTTDCCDEDMAYEEQWECTVDGDGNCTDCYIADTSCNCSACDTCDTDGLCPE